MLKNTKRKIIAAFLVLLVVAVVCIPNDWLHAERENISPADGVTVENYESQYSAKGIYYFKSKQKAVFEEGKPVFEPIEVIIDAKKYDSVVMNDNTYDVNNATDNFVVELSSEGKYEFMLTPKTAVKEDTDSSVADATVQGENDSETTAGAAEAALANSNPEASLVGDTSDTTTEAAADNTSDATTEAAADNTSEATTEAATTVNPVCFTIVIDNTPPSISKVSLNIIANQRAYYNVYATDVKDEVMGVGIEKIVYYKQENDKQESTEKEDDKTFCTGNIEESENKITYTFYAVDYLGNQSALYTDEKNYIDFMAPSCKIEPMNEKNIIERDDGIIYYFDENALDQDIFNITFEDKCSGIDVENLKNRMKEFGNSEYEICAKNSTALESEQNKKIVKDIWSIKLRSLDEKKYIITNIAAQDMVLNKSMGKTVQFIYDETVPQIGNVEITEAVLVRTVEGITYYRQGNSNGARVAFTVKEKNLQSVTVTFKGKDNIIEPKEKNGDVYSFEFELGTSDFENQTIQVAAVDYAGHRVVKSLEDNITYDTAPPEIKGISIGNRVSDGDFQDLLNSERAAKETEGATWGYSKENILVLDFEEKNFYKQGLTVSYCKIGDGGTENLQKVLYDGTESGVQKTDVTVKNGSVTVAIPDVALDDGIYRFTVRCKDKADNEMEEVNKYIMVDTKPPVLKFSKEMGTVDVPEQQPHRQQKQKSVKLHLEAADANLKDSGMFTWKLRVTDSKNAEIERLSYRVSQGKGTEAEYRDTDISALQAYLGTKANWVNTQKDNIYTMDIEFFTEGNYALEEVYLVDNSNRKSESEEVKEAFTIDGTTPVLDSLKYSIREKEYSDYKFIGKEILKVTFHVEDAISGIHSVKLSYLNPANSLLEYTAHSSGNGNYICNIPSEGEDFKGTIKSIFVEDKNDNILEHKINKGVIIDQETKETNQLLEVSIDDNTASFKKNIYNKDIELQLRAADTFSGLKNIAYSINGVNQEVNFLEKNASLTYEWINTSAKLEATKENEGEEIKVLLSAEDNAGNTKEISRTYVVDVTKPEIDIQFEDNSGAQYFNSNRKAVITIKELHLDVADIEVSITKDGKKSKIKPDFATTDNKTYVAEVKFSGDADYDMTVSCTDMAGNVAKKKTVDEFTIDKTDPKIKVSFDNNHAVNQKYYAGQRTATITVEEHNFDSQQVNIEIGASLDGAAIAAPSVSRFTSEGDVHTAHVTFAGDGNYTMSCRLSDLAGNDSASVEVQEFVIDQMNPEIMISGIEEGMSYNGEILPVINISDLNFNASEVNIVLTGLRSGIKTAFSIARTETDKTGVYRYEDFPHVIENDDYYILKASAHDMAGNLIEKTVEFRVNRFGSNYLLDEDTRRVAEQYYTNMDGSIVFVEENVDEIDERELSYSKEGDIVYLEEGKDYTVGYVQGEDHWNTYRYSIDTAGITQDGIYSFMLYSKDAVGNEMNNKSKNLILDICLDRTAPLCTVSGVENDGVYAEAERQAVIEVYDNISLDRVCVYLNGQETVYTAADITDNTILLALKEASRKQELRVVCYDSAGNVYDTAGDGNIIFTLSTNALTTAVSRITNNMALKVIIITVSIALVILFLALMLWKNKKEKQ